MTGAQVAWGSSELREQAGADAWSPVGTCPRGNGSEKPGPGCVQWAGQREMDQVNGVYTKVFLLMHY